MVLRGLPSVLGGSLAAVLEGGPVVVLKVLPAVLGVGLPTVLEGDLAVLLRDLL